MKFNTFDIRIKIGTINKMSKTLTPSIKTLRVFATLLGVFFIIIAPVLPASASVPTAPIPSTLNVINNEKNTDAKSTANSEVLPKMDNKGVPYLETVRAGAHVSEELVIQLAASGELKMVYVDDTSRVGALLTKGGVVMKFPYDASPEILSALIDAKVNTEFTKFQSAPMSEIERIEKQSAKSNWSKMLMLLPFLIVIGGCCIIYELRQRDIRKRKTTSDDEHTVFQTRDGPGGSIPTVTFADVAGCEEAREDLAEIVEFLKDPERFERLGAKIPRGALLVGPPGTGKTLLARAVAGEAKVDFFSASGSDFVEMYVGVGPARVRELFTKARNSEKAIIFIDEIDAVARSRATSTKQNANDERENTLNALLHELDGFSRTNVILLAATNRADMLDPAILRPGRLDRKIQVPNPDRRGREKILAVHIKGKPLAKDVDLTAIAKRTPGMSGADLSQIANEAAIEAARRNRKNIDASCFSAAVALVAMGRARKSAQITDRDRLITAYHEAGHTICAIKHEGAMNPAGVSITPRGHAGGITWMNGSDDQYMARNQAEAQLVVALGGRAGEELLLNGDFTQGPSSDLEKATQLATIMVTRYGMTRRGLAVRSGEPDKVSHDVIEELLASALDKARSILDENRALFSAIVNQLLEHDTLESSDLEDLAASVAEGGDHHQSFGDHTTRALQLAGSAAAETLGSVVSRAGRAVRRPTEIVTETISKLTSEGISKIIKKDRDQKTPSKAAGKTPSKAAGKTPSKSAGKTPSKAVGKTPSKSAGKASEKSAGNSNKAASNKSKVATSGISNVVLSKSPIKAASATRNSKADRSNTNKLHEGKKKRQISKRAQSKDKNTDKAPAV
jgi:cell division protease FtsH